MEGFASSMGGAAGGAAGAAGAGASSGMMQGLMQSMMQQPKQPQAGALESQQTATVPDATGWLDPSAFSMQRPSGQGAMNKAKQAMQGFGINIPYAG